MSYVRLGKRPGTVQVFAAERSYDDTPMTPLPLSSQFSLDRIRLAKAITTMSAEYGVSFERLVAEIDREPDDTDLTRDTVAFLEDSPRGKWDAWLDGEPAVVEAQPPH